MDTTISDLSILRLVEPFEYIPLYYNLTQSNILALPGAFVWHTSQMGSSSRPLIPAGHLNAK